MCDIPSGEASNAELQAEVTEMVKDGYRGFVAAEGSIVGELDVEASPPEPLGLTFLGFLGRIDSLRSA